MKILKTSNMQFFLPDKISYKQVFSSSKSSYNPQKRWIFLINDTCTAEQFRSLTTFGNLFEIKKYISYANL